MGFDRFLPRRLRARFTVLALACTAAIFLVILPFVISIERKVLFTQQINEIESYLDTTVSRSDSDIRATRQEAMALADEIQQWSPKDRKVWFEMMERALQRLPKASGIRVAFEPDGRIGPADTKGLYVRRSGKGQFEHSELAYSPLDEAAPGTHWYLPLHQVSGEKWLDGLWSDRFVAPETAGEPVVACSVPIYHLRGATNHFDGVVSIDMSTDVFRDFFRRIDLYQEAQIYLISPDKKVVLVVATGRQGGSDAEKRMIANVADRRDAFSEFPKIQDPGNPEGWFVAANPYSGEKTLIMFKKLQHNPAQLLYAIPVRAVQEKSLSLSLWIAFFGLFSIVGIGLLLRWSAGQATRNLDVLSLGVRDMQRGAVLVKLKPAVGNDETADVIDAFNSMVTEIDRSMRRSEQLVSEREREAAELNLARRIQESSLPSPIYLPGGDILSRMLSAREVAGDFYEHFPLPLGRVALLVGDVSGKSVSAALFAARSAQLLRSLASVLEPVDALAQVNAMLARSNPELMFVTLFFAVWDPVQQTLRWINAGHNPPLLVRADGRIERLDRRGGPALGPFKGKRYTESESSFAAGDLLAIYTDGITEAPAPDGQQFGEERLKEMLATHRDSTLACISDDVLAAVGAWQGEGKRFDDITLLLTRAFGPVRALELAADLANIEVVVDALQDYARQSGIDEASAKKIALAVCEAVTNIIMHALGSDPSRHFRVFFGCTCEALVIRFEDEGPVFDPQELPSVNLALPLARRPIGGLGWVLIRNVCDEVRMERIANTNILTLVCRHKRHDAPDSAA
ncbi:SpoIIE family protein phosphatase [Propionivibrio sp.]|uniref:SpoIIE family protein phosphatase n=1 Tax=Propionivibrio sp. TaxID=2212460 RepID=UPI003BF3B787